MYGGGYQETTRTKECVSQEGLKERAVITSLGQQLQLIIAGGQLLPSGSLYKPDLLIALGSS